MRLKVTFEGVEVRDGDVVVVRPSSLIPRCDAKELYDIAQKAFPNNHVVVLLPEYSIKTYDKEAFLEFLESLRKLVEGNTT